MHKRYEETVIRRLFSPEHQIDLWKNIEVAYMEGWTQARPATVLPVAVNHLILTPAPEAEAVRTREQYTGHDVIAFLQLWTEAMLDANRTEGARWLHHGLTSSDLTETARIKTLAAVRSYLIDAANELRGLLSTNVTRQHDIVRVGRTHGAVAEPARLGYRFEPWMDAIDNALDTLREIPLDCTKPPGALGNFGLVPVEVADVAAKCLGMTLAPATQVPYRDYVMDFAYGCLKLVTICEEVALQYRLWARERKAIFNSGQSSSSAMPHKNNPIVAERISGFARMARGYFLTVAESVTMFDDRDISNSVIDRVTVEDLCHITHKTLTSTISMVFYTVLHGPSFQAEVYAAGQQIYSSLLLTLAVEFAPRATYPDAHLAVAAAMQSGYAPAGEVAKFVAEHGGDGNAFMDRYKQLADPTLYGRDTLKFWGHRG